MVIRDNMARPIKYSDIFHEKERERSRRYRERKKKKLSEIKAIDE